MEKQQEQEEEFQKQAEGNVENWLKEGNVELLSFFREPTMTIEAIEDSHPTLTLSTKENYPPLALQDAAHDNDSEDDTDVEKTSSLSCTSQVSVTIA